MFLWSKQSLKWMQDAANYTDYYKILADQTKDLVSKESRICEIGCGIGYLSIMLSKYAKKITSVDVAKEALTLMKQEIESRKIKNINLIEDDWKNISNHYKVNKFDITIYSNFSAITTDWDKLIEMTDGYIVAVLPRYHSANHSERETITSALMFLNENKIDYQYIRHDIPFGQPFFNKDEMKEYLDYYKIYSEEKVQEIMNHPLSKDGFYYLDKIKKGGTIIINLQDNRMLKK